MPRPIGHGKHAAGQAFAKRLHGPGLLHIGLEAGGIGVSQVVGAQGHAVHVFFGARHGDIKQMIHFSSVDYVAE